MPIKIYIVDDHKIFRDGISSLISFEEEMEVVGSVQEFMADIKTHEPDVILMDISLQDGSGTDATKWLKEQNIDGKVLILSMHREEKYVKKVLECGADGFLLKDAGTKEMLNTIKTVYQGDNFYSHEIMQSLVKQLTNRKTATKDLTGEQLSKREMEVLKLFAEEKSNQEVADALFISTRTVDTHRRNMLDKLQLKNNAGLVKHALRIGLIEL
ncbi:MAG: DNA-binding NarL/FixJ family response regulator [Salibacteraceae bacterium]|jgi:DNA-binding NarL/FixJ family response regulator